MPTMEHVFDWLVTAVGAVVAWLATQWARLRGDLRRAEADLAEVKTRAAVLEARFDSVPTTLREIKDEIKGLRVDFQEQMQELNKRVDGKADKGR